MAVDGCAGDPLDVGWFNEEGLFSCVGAVFPDWACWAACCKSWARICVNNPPVVPLVWPVGVVVGMGGVFEDLMVPVGAGSACFATVG